jgi:hypothetical protein
MHPEQLRTATRDLFDATPQIVESRASMPHQIFACRR